MSAPLPAGGPSGSRTRLHPSPALVVGAFLLLLAAVFAVSLAVGSAAGPVNPSMRPAPTGVPMNGHGGMPGMDMGGMR